MWVLGTELRFPFLSSKHFIDQATSPISVLLQLCIFLVESCSIPILHLSVFSHCLIFCGFDMVYIGFLFLSCFALSFLDQWFNTAYQFLTVLGMTSTFVSLPFQFLNHIDNLLCILNFIFFRLDYFILCFPLYVSCLFFKMAFYKVIRTDINSLLV